MRSVREVILVEGRYDRNTLLQVVDAVVLETSGFGIYNNVEKRQLLLRLAAERGIVVLTDSDSAGFQIRNYLRSILPKEQVKHAYIPDIYGKERRKRKQSAEGKLGVEGMRPEILLKALEQAGASFTDQPDTGFPHGEKISKADLFRLGFSGGKNSTQRRSELLRRLDLPSRMTADHLLEVLNVLMTREEFLKRFSAETEETNVF